MRTVFDWLILCRLFGHSWSMEPPWTGEGLVWERPRCERCGHRPDEIALTESDDHLYTDGGMDLSEFGAGVDEAEEEAETQADGRADGADIGERCRALNGDGTGERCENAVSKMHDEPLCGPHYRANNVTLIDDVEDWGEEDA